MGDDTVITTAGEGPATSKAEAAYDWIGRQIASQRFAPGHRLVLSQLANEIGVSVAPVREALRRLQAEGLVTYERNVGAQVAMVDERAYADVMQTLGICEAAATALAAPHLSAADVARARDINNAMSALVASVDAFDPQHFTRLNQDFHEALFVTCPNRYLQSIVRTSWSRLDSLRESTFAFIPGRATSSVAEHANILALIEGGADPAEVEHAARQHRLATLESYLGHRAAHT